MKDFPREEAAVHYDPEEPPDSETDDRVAAVKRQHEMQLLAIGGVEGVGVGTDEIGNDVIVLYLRDSAVADRVPKVIEGVAVRTEVTGIVDALD